MGDMVVTISGNVICHKVTYLSLHSMQLEVTLICCIGMQFSTITGRRKLIFQSLNSCKNQKLHLVRVGLAYLFQFWRILFYLVHSQKAQRKETINNNSSPFGILRDLQVLGFCCIKAVFSLFHRKAFSIQRINIQKTWLCHVAAEDQGKCTASPGISDLADNSNVDLYSTFLPGRWLKQCQLLTLKTLNFLQHFHRFF